MLTTAQITMTTTADDDEGDVNEVCVDDDDAVLRTSKSPCAVSMLHFVSGMLLSALTADDDDCDDNNFRDIDDDDVVLTTTSSLCAEHRKNV
jgi:hypothetical protein